MLEQTGQPCRAREVLEERDLEDDHPLATRVEELLVRLRAACRPAREAA